MSREKALKELLTGAGAVFIVLSVGYVFSFFLSLFLLGILALMSHVCKYGLFLLPSMFIKWIFMRITY